MEDYPIKQNSQSPNKYNRSKRSERTAEQTNKFLSHNIFDKKLQLKKQLPI